MNTFFAICLFLTFKFVDGNECSFPADGLSMTVADEALVVKSADMSATLKMSDLASMRFTDSAESGMQPIDNSSAIEVFSLKGESLGSYVSIENIKKSIPGGTYILRQGNISIKISF